MEPQRDSSSYSPKRNIANSYRTADKYPENVSREDSRDKHVTERKYILRLEFVRTYDGMYTPGDHINLDNYTVALIYSDGSFKAVTRECRYNLGSEEVAIGGIVLKPNDGNPEHYTFTGYDPDDLVAFYITIEGRELMATTPLKYGMDLRDWLVAPYADINVTYEETGFIVHVYDIAGVDEWLYKKINVQPHHNYRFTVCMSTSGYNLQNVIGPDGKNWETAIYITSVANQIEDHSRTNIYIEDYNNVLVKQIFRASQANAIYDLQFNSGDNSELYVIIDFTPMINDTATACTIHYAYFYEVQ